MGRVRFIIILLIVLGLSVYLLNVFDSRRSGIEDMTNEQMVIEESGKEESEPEYSEPSITAQQVLGEIQGSSENVLAFDNSDISYSKGLFSWDDEVRQPENRSGLYVTVGYLGINEVYQDFASVEVNDKQANALARELQLLGVDLYLLSGHSEWAYEADGAPMLAEIERAQAFREVWGADTLKGVVFDIEPYGSDRWKQGEKASLMQNLVSGMRIAYNAAKESGLRMILVIPTWYDKQYNEYFIQLNDCCDEISVMNYVKKDGYFNMIDEVEYARAQEIEVTCIFEFQRVGVHNLTDESTYYNDGIEAAVANFEELYREYGYSKLKFAFHYLKPIEELLLDWQE